MKNIFILFLCIITTTSSFILPPKIHHTHTKLFEKNDKLDFWNDFTSKVMNFMRNDRSEDAYTREDSFIREEAFNKKFIEFENSFNEKTHNFFKLNENYNSNFTNLVHNHIDCVLSFNDRVINYINSFDVKSFNENIKKIKDLKIPPKIPPKQDLKIPLETCPSLSNHLANEFVKNFMYKIVKSNNDNKLFIQSHYMIFKNLIFETLTPIEQESVRSWNENEKKRKCNQEMVCNCDEYDRNVSTHHNDEKDVYYECHCYEEANNESECLIDHIHTKECSNSTKSHNITDTINKLNDHDNNFIDTIGLVPVGIFPNFIIKFLLKHLLIPF